MAAPFAAGEFAFEAIKQFVEQLQLPRVQRQPGPVVPDVSVISAVHAEIVGGIARIRKNLAIARIKASKSLFIQESARTGGLIAKYAGLTQNPYKRED
ncbi:MAG: hypothetical protein HPY82_00650 [Gammaproteobacteria bacterium]|nr:hypothetical protein [Gammaproteobacteria bacterium]